MSENAALERFIETSKTNFEAGFATVIEYPNVKMQKLLLLDILVPKKFHKTVDLTEIAEALAPLADREVIEDAEAFMSTDGRLGINVSPKRVSQK